MMVYIYTKFHENILNGIRVMERTRKVNDRRTDGRTDGCSARHNTTRRLRRAYNNGLKCQKIINSVYVFGHFVT